MPDNKFVHRELQKGDRGPDAKKLQEQVNVTLEHYHFNWRKISEDGKLGKDSFRAIHLAAWRRGFSEKALSRIRKGKVNKRDQKILRHSKKASVFMKRRAKSRRDEAQKIIRKHRESLDKDIVEGVNPGDPDWGGGFYLIDKIVDPVAARHGAYASSRKRPRWHYLSISNPGSDHNEANVYSYATDYATTAGADDAVAIAKALGIQGYSVGNYNAYYVNYNGHTFKVQILWAVSGHYDHVHVGIQLVS